MIARNLYVYKMSTRGQDSYTYQSVTSLRHKTKIINYVYFGVTKYDAAELNPEGLGSFLFNAAPFLRWLR